MSEDDVTTSDDGHVSVRPRVALLIESSNAYGRGILEGIIEYLHCHQTWSLYIPEQGRGASPTPQLRSWNLDGMIARVENEEIAHAVEELNIPVVDVSAARLLHTVPWVETDDSAISRLAYNHLAERGYRNFGFVGDAKFNWSRWRGFAFRENVVQGRGAYFEFPCGLTKNAKAQPVIGENLEGSFDESEEALASWLKGLPKPIGLMAAFDLKGQQILNLCRDLGISVPEEVSLIGVDNDPLVCELSEPTLTSVIPDAQRAGYIAAELLAELLAGRATVEHSKLIEPIGIQARQSTDIHAIDDEIVAQAMQMIRKHACDGLTVASLMKNLPVSRRIFEHRFMKAVGRTPHAEIVRVRMERVKFLLLRSDYSISEIARMTGYAHDEYLSSSFKLLEAMSPTQYRQQFRIE